MLVTGVIKPYLNAALLCLSPTKENIKHCALSVCLSVRLFHAGL